MADKVDPRRAFEAIARILGEREHVEITVKDIRKKEDAKEDTA